MLFGSTVPQKGNQSQRIRRGSSHQDLKGCQQRSILLAAIPLNDSRNPKEGCGNGSKREAKENDEGGFPVTM